MIIIGNGRLVTREIGNSFYENEAVAADGEVIVKVGETEALKKEFPDARFVDARGGVIMPAFINVHEHIYSAMARGLSIRGYDPHGFLDILDGMWWNIDRHLTMEQIRLSAMATYIDSIKNGVTTVFDHHASFGCIPDSLSAIEEAAKALGSAPVSAMRSQTVTGRRKPDSRCWRMNGLSATPWKMTAA